MDGFATLGPLPYRSSLLSRPEEKHKDVKHLSPRLARTQGIPHERCLATRAGHTYEEHHRRELLALGIFLTAAAQAQDALAGQSNGQLADEVLLLCSITGKGESLPSVGTPLVPGWHILSSPNMQQNTSFGLCAMSATFY